MNLSDKGFALSFHHVMKLHEALQMLHHKLRDLEEMKEFDNDSTDVSESDSCFVFIDL